MFVCVECGGAQADAGPCPVDGTPLAPIGEDLLLGTTIGVYRVARLLGIGGMGRVYKGVHPTIGSRVAIKVLSRECTDRRDLVERFFAEAKAVNLIRHESIVNVLDLAMLPDGRPYIIMEYLDGTSLAAIVAEAGPTGRPLPIGGLARLAVEVLDALAAAHAKGIVHRDLKPDNILVAPSGRAKVLDFGIAKLIDSTGTSTRTGSLLGTPHYMSPEQAAGQPVDHRADLYAMGVILFECATGQKPFAADSLFELLRKQVEVAPPPPRSLRADLPPEVEAVILTALQKAPELRFASAVAMSTALQHATAQLPASHWTPIVASGTPRPAPAGGWSPTPPASWAGARPARESVQPPIGHLATVSAATPAPRRSRRWLALAAALLVAGAGIGVIVANRGGDHDEPAAAVAQPAPAQPVPVEVARTAPAPAAPAPTAPAPTAPAPAEIAPRDEPPVVVARAPAKPAPTPPVIAAEADEPAPPPPPRPDAWIVATDLPGPPSFDPKRADVAAFITYAIRVARQADPDAQLVRIDVDGVAPDGRADLSLPSHASDHGSISLRFISPSRLKRDPRLPLGVPAKHACEFRVEAEPRGIQIRPVPLDCGKQNPLPIPRCTAADLWKRAIAQRAPTNAVAHLSYYAFGTSGPRWIFQIGHGFDVVFSTQFPGC